MADESMTGDRIVVPERSALPGRSSRRGRVRCLHLNNFNFSHRPHRYLVLPLHSPNLMGVRAFGSDQLDVISLLPYSLDVTDAMGRSQMTPVQAAALPLFT